MSEQGNGTFVKWFIWAASGIILAGLLSWSATLGSRISLIEEYQHGVFEKLAEIQADISSIKTSVRYIEAGRTIPPNFGLWQDSLHRSQMAK
jgi:hypothetical protein